MFEIGMQTHVTLLFVQINIFDFRKTPAKTAGNGAQNTGFVADEQL